MSEGWFSVTGSLQLAFGHLIMRTKKSSDVVGVINPAGYLDLYQAPTFR